jgi:hypothetical protein
MNWQEQRQKAAPPLQLVCRNFWAFVTPGLWLFGAAQQIATAPRVDSVLPKSLDRKSKNSSATNQHPIRQARLPVWMKRGFNLHQDAE